MELRSRCVCVSLYLSLFLVLDRYESMVEYGYSVPSRCITRIHTSCGEQLKGVAAMNTG
jgi:hypothetical protein